MIKALGEMLEGDWKGCFREYTRQKEQQVQSPRDRTELSMAGAEAARGGMRRGCRAGRGLHFGAIEARLF